MKISKLAMPKNLRSPESVSEKPDWDNYFASIAVAVSRRASCPRKSVGAVIVREYDKRIVGTGYNGAPSGEPECIEVGCDIFDGHCRRTIHAESNALGHSILNPQLDYTIYVTLEPCDSCYEELKKYRINRVVYIQSQEEYCAEKDLDNGRNFK